MDRRTMERVLDDVERRVGRIEQILPTLATKDDLRKAIAPLATKEEVRAEGERTRAHFDAVAERLEEQMRLLAEALLSLTRQFDEFKAETNARFAQIEERLTRLEARYAGS